MRALGLFALLVLSAALAAQTAPKITPPDKATLDLIAARTEKLAEAVDRLKERGVRELTLADIEVFLKAARWIVKHGEFYRDGARQVLPVLDHGLLRASQQARGESPWYTAPGQTVLRAYRSRLDGSVQPFAVTYPHDYGLDARKRYRLDVVLHGRDAGLTEVSFLHRHGNAKPPPKDLVHVRLDIFGRGNNGYRWAGESDVFEAVETFFAVENYMKRGNFVDPKRVVLRGFSMGGAGTWHIGLHRPDQFAVLGPGAGFTTTHGYVAGLPEKLPDYQEACLRIYDAADYAENAFNVPIVAYTGENDKQIAAARNIEARLKPLGVSITHLVAPKTEHRMPPEWQAKAEEEYAKHVARERPDYPPEVRFVTYTLKYSGCAWVDIVGMERHYDQARVEAKKADDALAVKTANVRALRLGLWPGATREPITVTIDEQKLEGVRPVKSGSGELSVYLEKAEGKWGAILPERLVVDRLRSPQKASGLQGPIDDAFTAPFLCVRGTGKPWHAATEEYARANLERFRAEWSRYFRGDLPVKDDVEVTADDIASRHLILFGDPSSNSLIEQVAAKLPLTWTSRTVTLFGKGYDSGKHVPVMIYPSPLAADRYVVLNSGHTFHAKDFQGTNALLYPRLGDFAVLRLTGDGKDPLAAEVQAAGLFDEYWRQPRR